MALPVLIFPFKQLGEDWAVIKVTTLAIALPRPAMERT